MMDNSGTAISQGIDIVMYVRSRGLPYKSVLEVRVVLVTAGRCCGL